MSDASVQSSPPSSAGSAGTEMAAVTPLVDEGGWKVATSPTSKDTSTPLASDGSLHLGSALGLSGLDDQHGQDGKMDRGRTRCTPALARLTPPTSEATRVKSDASDISPSSSNSADSGRTSLLFSDGRPSPTTPGSLVSLSTRVSRHPDQETPTMTGRELDYGRDEDGGRLDTTRGKEVQRSDLKRGRVEDDPATSAKRARDTRSHDRSPERTQYLPWSAPWTLPEDGLLEKYICVYRSSCPTYLRAKPEDFIRSIQKNFPGRSFSQISQRFFHCPNFRLLHVSSRAPDQWKADDTKVSVLGTRMRSDRDEHTPRERSPDKRPAIGRVGTPSSPRKRAPPTGPRHSAPFPYVDHHHPRLAYLNGELVDPSNLYVTYISRATTEEDLQSAFRRYGRIKSTSHVSVNSALGPNCGSMFISFVTDREAQVAKEAMHNKMIRGSRIKVNYHHPNPDRFPSHLLPRPPSQSERPHLHSPRLRCELSPPPSTRTKSPRSTLEPGEIIFDLDYASPAPKPDPDAEVSTLWMRQTDSGLLDGLVKHLEGILDVEDRIVLMRRLECKTQAFREEFLESLVVVPKREEECMMVVPKGEEEDEKGPMDWEAMELEIKREVEEVDFSLLC